MRITIRNHDLHFFIELVKLPLNCFSLVLSDNKSFATALQLIFHSVMTILHFDSQLFFSPWDIAENSVSFFQSANILFSGGNLFLLFNNFGLQLLQIFDLLLLTLNLCFFAFHLQFKISKVILQCIDVFCIEFKLFLGRFQLLFGILMRLVLNSNVR